MYSAIEPEERTRSPEKEVTDSCKLPSLGAGNLSLLQDPDILLTAEPSLQPPATSVCFTNE